MDLENGLGEVLVVDVVAIDLDAFEEGEDVGGGVYSRLVACLFEDVGSF